MAVSKGSARPAAAGAAKAGGWQAWQVALLAVAGLLVAFEVYGPALHGPFVLDDGLQWFGRPDAQGLPFRYWVNNVRPLLGASYWLNFQWSGDDTFSYHAVNVILHWLNSILIFTILRRLWRTVGREDIIAPLFGAGLFLLHPLQTESVAYVSSRSEVLSVLFAYGALTLVLRRSGEPLPPGRVALVLLLLGCAVLTKEHTAVLPVVFLLVDYFWTTPWQLAGVRRNWKLYAPVAIFGVVGLRLVLRVLQTADTAGFRMKDLPWHDYFFTQCRVIWDYLRLFLLPWGQNADPDIRIARSMLEPGTLAGAAGILTLLGAAWYFRRNAPLASFGVLTFLVLLAPTSSFVPIRDLFAERRVYLPMIGLLCVVLEGLRRWRVPTAALAIILLACGVLSYQRSQVWSSALALWEDSAAKSPRKVRTRFQLAYAYYAQNRCVEAEREFAQTATLGEPDDRLMLDWAHALDCLGRYEDAVAKATRASELAAKPNEIAHARSFLGMLHGKAGQYEKALAALDEAEKADTKFAMLYVYRGHIFRAQRNLARAAEEYDKALRLEPRNEAALQGRMALQGGQ